MYVRMTNVLLNPVMINLCPEAGGLIITLLMSTAVNFVAYEMEALWCHKGATKIVKKLAL